MASSHRHSLPPLSTFPSGPSSTRSTGALYALSAVSESRQQQQHAASPASADSQPQFVLPWPERVLMSEQSILAEMQKLNAPQCIDLFACCDASYKRSLAFVRSALWGLRPGSVPYRILHEYDARAPIRAIDPDVPSYRERLFMLPRFNATRVLGMLHHVPRETLEAWGDDLLMADLFLVDYGSTLAALCALAPSERPHYPPFLATLTLYQDRENTEMLRWLCHAFDVVIDPARIATVPHTPAGTQKLRDMIAEDAQYMSETGLHDVAHELARSRIFMIELLTNRYIQQQQQEQEQAQQFIGAVGPSSK